MPNSPKPESADDDEEENKKWGYRLDIVKHELEMERLK